jgi:type I restriction enzyme S subunit
MTPKLRFPLYNQPFVKKPINEILTIGSGKDYKHLSKGEIPVYGTGGLMTTVNDHLYDGESVGIGRKGTIDKPIFLKGKFWTVDTLFYTHSFEDVDPYYVFTLFQQINWKKYNEASGVPSLSKTTVGAIQVYVPRIEEQLRIRSLFEAVDQKINLLTKKKEALETYKKGLMQKIFSQELRFKREDGTDYSEWTSLLIGQSAKILKGKGISKADICELGAYDCIRYGELYTVFKEVILMPHSKTNQEISDSVLSMKGDVLIPASGETAIDMATACSLQLDKILIGADINIVRLKNTEYSELLAYALTNTHRNALARLAQGVSVVHLYGKHISSLTIPMPSSKEETQKIKNLLSSISKLITEVSKEIERVNTLKKGLLQQMFV